MEVDLTIIVKLLLDGRINVSSFIMAAENESKVQQYSTSKHTWYTIESNQPPMPAMGDSVAGGVFSQEDSSTARLTCSG